MTGPRTVSLRSDDSRRVSILPWHERLLDDLEQGEIYHGLLASVGYEPRSTVIGLALQGRAIHRTAVEFPKQQTESYKVSRVLLEGAGFEINQRWEKQFAPFVAGWLSALAKRTEHVRVAIDVSSMNRTRIAAVIETLARTRPVVGLTADLLYAPAELKLPPGLPEGVLSIKLVSPYFAGELAPGAITVGLLGIGYEPNKAAGALNSLEIPCGAIYIPNAPNQEIRSAVLDANRGLLDAGEEREQVDYGILDPFDCIARLEGRSHALLHAGDVPAIIPLGPKIFAVSGCIAAALNHPRVQVWRASFNEKEHSLKREADGTVCGVSVQLEPAHFGAPVS